MRFGKILSAILLLTTTLSAQSLYYGYPYYSNPYYPYYPSPYYPGSLPAYSQPTYYGSDPFAVSNADRFIDDLQSQIQRLQDQVQSLQNELTLATAPQPPQSCQPEVSYSVSETPATPVALVFKNGARIEAEGYAMKGNILWIVTPTGSQRYALSDLDFEATQRENLQRGITFPSSPPETGLAQAAPAARK
jgi:hypothetical protein